MSLKIKLLKNLNNTLTNLPTPSNINYMWNFGSILGMCFLIQIISGIFLSMHYSNNINLAFSSLSHIMRDVNYGWVLRNIHANGASFFFIFIYLHISRNLYFFSYHFIKTWFMGIMIFMTLMATAFLGYILPWGQMSFWGATVITNLFSVIPLFGDKLTIWMWGGFSVNNATLTRFYSLHFIMPFILMIFVIMHIIFLHESGSNNPLGLCKNIDKIPFHSFFSWKDIFGFSLFYFLFLFIIFLKPNLFTDPENFILANPLLTPIHIQPEWYFLFAYAILRSIPNKFGGVMGLIFSILIFLTLPFSIKNKYNNINNYFISKILFFIFINSFIFLTILGGLPAEDPFIFFSKMISILYFSYFLFLPLSLYFSSMLKMICKII